ncbi:MAG: hypothetical protein K6U14_05130 [Firmicutes bacterium]|nr:hypothetical protein [Alicyclobacillaceae bacterium]MCL6497001.1 hypothetical protein [Bacillota bacterium]
MAGLNDPKRWPRWLGAAVPTLALVLAALGVTHSAIQAQDPHAPLRVPGMVVAVTPEAGTDRVYAVTVALEALPWARHPSSGLAFSPRLTFWIRPRGRNRLGPAVTATLQPFPAPTIVSPPFGGPSPALIQYRIKLAKPLPPGAELFNPSLSPARIDPPAQLPPAGLRVSSPAPIATVPAGQLPEVAWAGALPPLGLLGAVLGWRLGRTTPRVRRPR